MPNFNEQSSFHWRKSMELVLVMHLLNLRLRNGLTQSHLSLTAAPTQNEVPLSPMKKTIPTLGLPSRPAYVKLPLRSPAPLSSLRHPGLRKPLIHIPLVIRSHTPLLSASHLCQKSPTTIWNLWKQMLFLRLIRQWSKCRRKEAEIYRDIRRLLSSTTRPVV